MTGSAEHYASSAGDGRQPPEASRRSVVTVEGLLLSLEHAYHEQPLVFAAASNRFLACMGVSLDQDQRVVPDLRDDDGDGGINVRATVGRFVDQFEALPGPCEVILPPGTEVEAAFPLYVVTLKPRHERSSGTAKPVGKGHER